MAATDDRIRAGGAVLAFDTNTILGFSRAERRVSFRSFFGFCNDAERLRQDERAPIAMHIVVPALVRMEALHDLRVSRGDKPFDIHEVKNGIKNKAEVRSFDEDAAILASGVLHRWFPSDDRWQEAKRQRLSAIVGQSRASAPATIDWAITAQAEAEGWILVTADKRAEFSRMSHTITKIALRSLFDDLLRERGLLMSGI
jgi:predicted nucleic acid-binding protein